MENNEINTGYISREEFYKKKRKKKLYKTIKLTIGTAFISIVITATAMAHRNKKNINDLAANDILIESYFQDGTIDDSNYYMIETYQNEMLNRSKMLIAQLRGMSIDDYESISIEPHYEKTGEIGGDIIIKGTRINYSSLSDLEQKVFEYAAKLTRESKKNNKYGPLKKEYDENFVTLIDKVSDKLEERNGKSK